MKKVIISYNRADKVITGKWLKDALICVPESQEEEYRKYNKHELMVIPDNEDGNCAKKKNAVLRRTEGEDVIIIDDDIRGIGYHEHKEMFVANEGLFNEMCLNMFQMIKDMDIIMWGVNVQSDGKFYREYSPFSLSSVVLGPFTCLRNIDSTIRFDESLWLKEDYDICLQVLKKYRKILRNNKWHYLGKHITTAGGLAGARTREEETRQNLALQKKWGNKVVKIQRRTQGGNISINPVVNSPIHGI